MGTISLGLVAINRESAVSCKTVLPLLMTASGHGNVQLNAGMGFDVLSTVLAAGHSLGESGGFWCADFFESFDPQNLHVSQCRPSLKFGAAPSRDVQVCLLTPQIFVSNHYHLFPALLVCL